MFGHRTLTRLTALAMAIGTLSSACDPDPSYQALGSLDITASDPPLAAAITTADGWTVQYSRFLVHVSSVEVAGSEGVVGASSTGQLFDFVSTTPKSLVSATVRTARNWDAVSFSVGPITDDTETVNIEPVTQADVDAMKAAGVAVKVQGQMSKAGMVKTFEWAFSGGTLYKDCESTRSGSVVRGLVVPPNGNDTVNVTFDGEGLFSDSLAAGGVPSGDDIAAADADSDGVITQDELQVAALSGTRAANVAGVEGAPADLGAFIALRASDLVGSFGNAGKCTAESASSGE